MTDRGSANADVTAVAAVVRRFYEQHPYPPPVDDLTQYGRLWSDPQRRHVDSYLFWPGEPYRDDRAILVAGCGTSQAAKHALRWPAARVIGIDVSANSIERTEKLKRKHRLDNLEVVQLAVERVSELGERFDQIICTGVLHHLPDPDTGLRALRNVLEPRGALHLMVYAPFGRAGVYLLQQYCRALGIGASDAEIRELAASLRALPQDHPLVPLLQKSPDFRSEAGIADALLHPQDRPYSVPEFFEFIGRAGFEFGRWVRQAAYLPQCGALSASPHRSLLDRLPAQQQYAAVELFRGRMVRHSAIVFRDDHPGEVRPIHFTGDAWRSYVPLRVPETVSVTERLPAGAAAVLINRAHTYTDIFLPIDKQQMTLLDRIDGQQTIDEIAQDQAGSDLARTFFERLWWYDQVVFNASNAIGPS